MFVLARNLVLSALALLGAAVAAAQPVPRGPSEFAVGDYFRLTRIVELALSPDGTWLAYVTEGGAPRPDGGNRSLYLQRLGDRSAAVPVPAASHARRIDWVPGTNRLAFLGNASGRSALHLLEPRDLSIRLEREAADPIVDYRYASDGRRLAFITRAAATVGTSLYEQLHNGDSGVLVDAETTSSHDFLNPRWNMLVRPAPANLWVADGADEARRVAVPGEPAGTVAWAPDSRMISIGFVADGAASRLGGSRSSLGLFEFATGRFSILLSAVPPRAGAPGISYSGGEWVAGTDRILVRRVVEADPWVSGSFPDWGLVESGAPDRAIAWHAGEFHPRARFLSRGAGEILVENIVRGVHSLFRLEAGDLRRSSIVAGIEGSARQFSFGRGGRDVAFVVESLTEPPEVYLSRNGEAARRITRLNADIAARIRFRSSEWRWRARGGTELGGWLLLPAEGVGPWPLVTFVHGGPAFAFPNAFAPYFDFWPYPLEVYPSRGMAVFIPNYRGTHTYGQRVASPAADEPAQDILDGIESLVARGIADRARLAISGQSHGALLGPQVMSRSNLFRAASFAEGVANSVVMYELMSGEANREIHDRVVGASLYDSPERYLAESAALHFRGIDTASLFEAGAYSAPLFMLGFPKSARRFGMPTEFIIYPQTGHNIDRPTLQREAAARNLDWFDFWLNGGEDPDPAKADQYVRWRSLRSAWQRQPR